jgi:hypothetical protein
VLRLGLLLAAGMAVACGEAPVRTELRPGDLKSDLETLAAARVYFGHQSVGGNVLEGLTRLSNEQGVPLRIVEAPVRDSAPGLVHAKVGRNRAPETKCDAFNQFLSARAGGRWDAALLKFCYADMGDGAERDPNRLFALYKKTMTAAQAANPDLLLVHATMPLQSEGLGKRNAIRKMVGLGTSNDADNVLRNDFNDLVRAEYGNTPLFDVAWAESTRPDGTRSGFRKDGRFIFTLAKEYTYDEGHLTTEGQRWVAREFARSVAAALRARTSADAGAVARAPQAVPGS